MASTGGSPMLTPKTVLQVWGLCIFCFAASSVNAEYYVVGPEVYVSGGSCYKSSSCYKAKRVSPCKVKKYYRPHYKKIRKVKKCNSCYSSPKVQKYYVWQTYGDCSWAPRCGGCGGNGVIVTQGDPYCPSPDFYVPARYMIPSSNYDSYDNDNTYYYDSSPDFDTSTADDF